MAGTEKLSIIPSIKKLKLVPRSVRRMVLNPMRNQHQNDQKPRGLQKLAQSGVGQHPSLEIRNVKGHPHQKRFRRWWLKLNNSSTINSNHTPDFGMKCPKSRFWDEILLTISYTNSSISSSIFDFFENLNRFS